MAHKVKELFRDGKLWGWWYCCPGCNGGHAFFNDGRWTFNGDLESPTFHPSLLLQGCLSHENGEPHGTCHVFVTNGQIQFLPDCTHGLAGKTVAMDDVNL